MFARASHRTRIVALVLASGLPVLLLAIFGLWRYLDASKQQIVDDRIAMAEAASLTTQAFIADVSNSAQTLALSPGVTDPRQRGNVQALLDGARVANPDWQSIAVLDAAGHSLASSGPAPNDTPQLRELLQQTTSGVTLETQPGSGGRVLISAPLKFADGSRGTLVVSPSMRVLATELRAQVRGPQLDLAVVDNNGAVVLAEPPGASVPHVRSTNAGASQLNTSRGQLLVVYAPIADVNWSILIGQPASVAFASLERQVAIAALAIILALAAAGLMAWVLGGRLSLYYERILRARDRAEEATAARDAVLASVSHDLQNPIAAAKGYLQLLQRRIATDPHAPAESLQKSLQQAERAVVRMQQMTEELVDSARLRAGYELALRPALTDLAALVQQVVDDQSAASNSYRIHVGMDSEELWVACDPARIMRVVANVLSNAIKYSPYDSQILVELRREDDPSGQWAVLSVSDEGIGIPAADLPHVFERYHRAGNASSQAGGTGLGLAGVRLIVEQHGGNIAIESHEGLGTTVRIRLPRSAGATAMAETRARRLA